MTSDAFQAFENDVAKQAGAKVVARELWRDVHDAIGNLSAADIQPGEVAGYLAANRDAAARFIVAVMARPDEHPDGEFPEGEEPNEDELNRESKSIGLSRGFSIRFAIYALLIDAPEPDKLTSYLKNRRISSAKNESKNIREHFARTHGR